jgi:hypothetical protein
MIPFPHFIAPDQLIPGTTLDHNRHNGSSKRSLA